MNSPCTLIAASFLMLQGCTSYYEMTREDLAEGAIPSEVAIRVTRHDGSVVESGPFRHVVVQKASDLVIGSGLERRTGKPFSGTLLRSEIDSVREVRIKDPHGDEHLYSLVWLTNKSSFAFEEYDHLSITPEHEPGLWCAGTVAEGDRSRPFKGRIEDLSIETIEAKGFTLFHPSTPTAGEHAGRSIHRMNLGLGFASVSGRGAAAFLVDYALLSRSTLYSIRMITTFTAPFPEAHTSPRLTEFAALYGMGVRSRFFAASAAAGISYVTGSERVALQGGAPGYRSDDFSTVSFPIGLELAITPFELFGIAAKYFSTHNSKRSCTGFVLSLQFGV